MSQQNLDKPSNFYICDPYKNVKCDGRFKPHCGIDCFCTTKPEFAMDPAHMLTYAEYYEQEGQRLKYKKSSIIL